MHLYNTRPLQRQDAKSQKALTALGICVTVAPVLSLHPLTFRPRPPFAPQCILAVSPLSAHLGIWRLLWRMGRCGQTWIIPPFATCMYRSPIGTKGSWVYQRIDPPVMVAVGKKTYAALLTAWARFDALYSTLCLAPLGTLNIQIPHTSSNEVMLQMAAFDVLRVEIWRGTIGRTHLMRTLIARGVSIDTIALYCSTTRLPTALEHVESGAHVLISSAQTLKACTDVNGCFLCLGERLTKATNALHKPTKRIDTLDARAIFLAMYQGRWVVATLSAWLCR